MTSEDIRSEIEKNPFEPFRLHLVSGKTIDVTMDGVATMLHNAVLILHDLHPTADTGYDVVALRNIERLEQLKGPSA